MEEASKCVLLCSNCHSEEHNPECVLQEQTPEQRGAMDAYHDTSRNFSKD